MVRYVAARVAQGIDRSCKEGIMWTISDRNGRVALTLGWGDSWTEPYRVREWIIGKAKTEHNMGIIGKRVEFNGNTGQVYDDLRGYRRFLQTDDETEWHRETERERIRKPRGGQGYDWTWERGRWRKVWVD